MKKYIPYEKLSPRQQRAVDNKSRTFWEISPVTRRPKNPKAYNRAKARALERSFFG